MNAPATIAPAPFDLNAAHMAAHKWVDIARPLIKAYLALDFIQNDVLVAAYEAEPNYANDYRVCSRRLANEMREMRADIESIRDQWLADLSPPAPNWGRNLHECSPEVFDYDDLCDEWQERIRDVLSVDAAIDAEARS
jgi:hypothetical protein